MRIRLFMWGYQPHFKVHAQTFAEGIFNKLDKNLNPNVFLIGILCEENADRHPICIQPEDPRYPLEIFSDILKISEEFEQLDERSNLFYSDPDSERDVKHRIKFDSIKNAVQKIIRESDLDNEITSFCSVPVLIEGYMVSVVLQLDRSAYNSHYSLKKNKRNRSYISRSLLESTINEYLNECSKELSKANPGKNLRGFEREYDDVIRSGGKDLMYTPASVGDIMGLHGLFEACNIISSLKYEGEEITGVLIISKIDHPNLEINLQYDSPIKLRDFGAVRKQLEISSDNIHLLSDSNVIYGFGTVLESYNLEKEDLFLIKFTSHYHWELIHAGNVLMKVRYGLPYLPSALIDKEKFQSDVKRIFADDIDLDDIERLWELILEAIKQKHGTMVVISKESKNEALRLKNQCIVIKPVELSPSLIQIVTSIDGAVLITPQGICHAIGVILDGVSSNKCTSSRGARYNSAIRYTEFTDCPCLIVVISEDSLIDLVPNLMPQINRSEIENELNKLRHLGDPDDDSGKFHSAMNWYDNHRFYLSSEICEEINKIKKEYEEKMSRKGITQMIYRNFIPNEEMDDSYFNDEDNS